MQTQTVTERGGPPVGGSSRMTLAIQLDGRAPTEVRLFRYGDNETTKGVFVFDAESAVAVMEADADYGNRRSADYEHQALQSPPVEAPASAWYRLSLRDDGLYAVDIEWTDRARQRIEAKEYRYISPAFAFNPETMQIVEFINFALTNLPATKRMEVLLRADPLADFMAANAETLAENGLMSPRQKMAMDALHTGARLYVDAFPVESYDEDAGYKDKEEYATDTDDEDYAALHDTPDAIETPSGSSPLQGADSSLNTPAPTLEESKMEENMTTILSALGLSDDATPEQITTAVKALSAKKVDPLEPVRAELGIRDGDGRVVAKQVAALKGEIETLQAANASLAEQVDTYEKVTEEQTVESLLSKARAEKGLTPAHEKAFLTALTNDDGRVEVKRLEAMLKALPAFEMTTQEKRKEPAKLSFDAEGKSYGELSPMEKVKLSTEDPERFQELRDAHYAAKNG